MTCKFIQKVHLYSGKYGKLILQQTHRLHDRTALMFQEMTQLQTFICCSFLLLVFFFLNWAPDGSGLFWSSFHVWSSTNMSQNNLVLN